MKKVKLFFTICLLLLSTVAVWAGKKRYVTNTVYAHNGTKYCPLTGATTLVNLTTTSCGSQATITDCSGTAYALYVLSGTTYLPLYFPGC